MSGEQEVQTDVNTTEQNPEAILNVTDNLPLTSSAVTPNVVSSLIAAEILVTPTSDQTVTNQTGKSNYMNIIIQL